jgi:probable phosphoglycerate mutase
VPSTRLLLVRHGETDWAKGRRHTGRTDIGLNATGEAQARDLPSRLPLDGVVAIWCSPLARSRDTAARAGLAVDAVDPDLIEWDYGFADGRTTAEIREERPGWTVWDDEITGGESLEQVGARADRVIARARAVEGTVALVGHAHHLRVLAARWLGLAPGAGRHLTLDPAGWGVLGWERETPVIERWNPPGPPT